MKTLRLSLAVLFHPVDSLSYIKRDRGKLNYIPSLIMFFMVVLVRILSIFIEHFPLAAVEPKDANLWLEIIRMLLPIFTWVLACYAVTTILEGEVLLGESFIASAYAMLPYIVFTIPVNLLSYLMHSGDKSLYKNLNMIILIWVLMLFFISVKELNDYTFAKAVQICIISLITMLLIWGVGALFFALTSQLYYFICEILLEIKLLFVY